MARLVGLSEASGRQLNSSLSDLVSVLARTKEEKDAPFMNPSCVRLLARTSGVDHVVQSRCEVHHLEGWRGGW